jgi:hypothetical protein
MLGLYCTAWNHANFRIVRLVPTCFSSKRHLKQGADDTVIRNQLDLISYKFGIVRFAPTRDTSSFPHTRDTGPTKQIDRIETISLTGAEPSRIKTSSFTEYNTTVAI